jgi:glutamyl-tRNA reductase
MEVACGLRSQILGEEQILTQLRESLERARGVGCADGVLQTLFRLAVTAGKEARSRVRLVGVPLSVAEQAVLRANEVLGGLEGLRALVVGNGKMGRLCAELLAAARCRVTVTRRSYRHGETVVPQGCDSIPYDERFAALETCDLLVSATASPHFVLTRAQLAAVRRVPRLMLDLAVPYDIEPSAAEAAGVRLINLNNLIEDGARVKHNAEELRRTGEIIARHEAEFYRWLRYSMGNAQKNTRVGGDE